jgi:hypothetical protein
MALDLKESRARNVPAGSTLVVKVDTQSTNVNATGLVVDPNGTDEVLKHAQIVSRAKRVRLSTTGLYIARVNVILNATTQETATVQYSIEDASGNQLRAFQPVFTGRTAGDDKFIGRAKYSIKVV